jgi:hypothetical protein
MFVVVVAAAAAYFVIDSVRKLLDTPSYSFSRVHLYLSSFTSGQVVMSSLSFWERKEKLTDSR